MHMVEDNLVGFILACLVCICVLTCQVCSWQFLLPGHTGLNLKHTLDTVGTGPSLRDCYNQIGQLHQLHQNLGHIVDQRYYLSLGDRPLIHPDRTGIKEYDRSHIDNDIGDRIGQRGYFAHKQLHMRQGIVFLLKALYLFLLFIEGPDHSGSRKILSGGAQHTVQPRLYLLIQRHRPHHDAKYDY